MVEVGEPVGEVGVRDGLAMAFGVNENYEDRSPNNTITGTNCILRIYVQIQTPLGRARGTATGWSPFYYTGRQLPRARMREGAKQSFFFVCLSVCLSGEKF